MAAMRVKSPRLAVTTFIPAVRAVMAMRTSFVGD